MKKIFLTAALVSLFLSLSPQVQAESLIDERSAYLRKRILVMRQIREADRGSDHYRYLRRKYRYIINTLRNLRSEEQRLVLRPTPVQVSSSPQVSQTSEPTPSLSSTLLEKQRLLRKRRRERLGLQPVTLNTTPTAEEEAVIQVELGKASYYADKFNGRTTASGSVFSNADLTAAHLTLDFGTRVRVIHPDSGNSVEVTITDRGPYVSGRIIDLTSTAFSRLAPLSRGVIDVRLEILD